EDGIRDKLVTGVQTCALPICTDVAGSRELVEEGVTGALCEPRDAASLADAMERIGRLSPDQLAKMGCAARDKVERDFSEEIVVRSEERRVGKECRSGGAG